MHHLTPPLSGPLPQFEKELSMKRTLRILSAALVLGAAACSSDTITGPQATPTAARHEGLGYLGGGGRSSVSAPAGRVTAP